MSCQGIGRIAENRRVTLWIERDATQDSSGKCESGLANRGKEKLDRVGIRELWGCRPSVPYARETH